MPIHTLQSDNYTIEAGNIEESSFSQLLNRFSDSKKVIIVDENTHEYCLEFLITQFEELTDAEVMLLPAGEENKVLEVSFQVWEALSEYRVGRSDLIINLGGGVITDMGGFIASVFKRGVHFINIPTTLLAMVDASVGGKTGIDLGPYKNQLGVFNTPDAVYIDKRFLSSLPESEWLNGYAEMLKHAIVFSKTHWKTIHAKTPSQITEEDIIESIAIKNQIVLADPKENGIRKLLNFGHTAGHAIEGYLLGKESPVPHGIAVAWGMSMEAELAFKTGVLNEVDRAWIQSVLASHFPPLPDFTPVKQELLSLMTNDKKNKSGKVSFVFPSEIGQADVNYSFDVDAPVLESLFFKSSDLY